MEMDGIAWHALNDIDIYALGFFARLTLLHLQPHLNNRCGISRRTRPCPPGSSDTAVDQNTASLLQVQDGFPVSQSNKQLIRLRVTR